MGHFCPPGSGSGSNGLIKIRIQSGLDPKTLLLCHLLTKMLDEDMCFRLLVHFEGKLIMPGNVHGLVEEDLLVQDSQGSQGVGVTVEVGEAVAQGLL